MIEDETPTPWVTIILITIVLTVAVFGTYFFWLFRGG